MLKNKHLIVNIHIRLFSQNPIAQWTFVFKQCKFQQIRHKTLVSFFIIFELTRFSNIFFSPGQTCTQRRWWKRKLWRWILLNFVAFVHVHWDNWEFCKLHFTSDICIQFLIAMLFLAKGKRRKCLKSTDAMERQVLTCSYKMKNICMLLLSTFPINWNIYLPFIRDYLP